MNDEELRQFISDVTKTYHNWAHRIAVKAVRPESMDDENSKQFSIASAITGIMAAVIELHNVGLLDIDQFKNWVLESENYEQQ